MPASRKDALVALQQQVPEICYRFAHEFLGQGLDVDKAAQAVGRPGEGQELLLDPQTQRVLRALTGAVPDVVRDERELYMQMVAALASYDPIDAFDATGQAKHVHELPAALRAAVKVKVEPLTGSVSYEIPGHKDRLAAVRLGLEHFADAAAGVSEEGELVQVVFEQEPAPDPSADQ